MNKKTINSRDNAKMVGWTERRLFDTPKFIEAINYLGADFKYNKVTPHTLTDAYEKALKIGIKEDVLKRLFDQAAKPMFKENRLWDFFHKHFKLDIQIPFIFGFWTTQPIRKNTITNVGKKIAADQTGGTTTVPVTAIAIGIGTPTATALGSEITTGGGARGAATVSNQTTTTTGDTERWVKTFTFTSSFAITEEGLFDNNTSGGNMLASQSFSVVNVVNTDTLQITHNVKFA